MSAIYLSRFWEESRKEFVHKEKKCLDCLVRLRMQNGPHTEHIMGLRLCYYQKNSTPSYIDHLTKRATCAIAEEQRPEGAAGNRARGECLNDLESG